MFVILLAVLAAGPAGDRVPAPPADAKSEALTRYALARLHLGRENLPAAARNLEAAAAADPAAVTPLRDLVPIYTDLGRDAAAIRTAKKVVAIDPADADTGHALGRLLFAAGRFADAAAALKIADASSRLAGRPTKALAVKKDLARCLAAAKDPAAASAYVVVEVFCAAKADGLRKDGFTPVEISREAAAAAESAGRAFAAANGPDAAADAFRRAAKLYADPAAANDPAAAAQLQWNLAGVHLANNDSPAAATALEGFLALRPSGAEAYEKYAAVLRRVGRPDDVLPALRKYAAADPKNTSLPGLIAVETVRGDFAAGHALVLEAAKTAADPGFAKAVAAAYFDANRPAEFLDLLDAVFTAAQPKPAADLDPRVNRAAAGDRSRAFADAVAAVPREYLTRLLRQAGQDLQGKDRRTETVELLAWAADRAGLLAEAEDMLTTAMRGQAALAPEVPRALLKLLTDEHRWDDLLVVCLAGMQRPKGAYYFYTMYKAHAEVELGRGAAALRTIDSLENEVRFAARREKVRLLGVLGRYPDMAKTAREAMVEFPDPADVQAMRYQLSDAYNGMKQFDKAEAELRLILEDDPDDALALNNLGYHLADQGRKLAEAEELVRRAVELDTDDRGRAGFARPENAAYLDSLGWVLFRRGKLAEARDTLTKASLLPDGRSDPTVWDHLGDVCFRLNDKPAAKVAWATAARRYGTSLAGKKLGRLDEVTRKLRL